MRVVHWDGTSFVVEISRQNSLRDSLQEHPAESPPNTPSLGLESQWLDKCFRWDVRGQNVWMSLAWVSYFSSWCEKRDDQDLDYQTSKKEMLGRKHVWM